MNIELEIERICQERGVYREDFTDRRQTPEVVGARRELAKKFTLAHPEWPIVYIGQLLGLAPGSARLGQGIFRF